MKYKAGDKVRIKSLDWYNENKDETDDIECSNNIWFYREMSKFCGKVMTISHDRVDHYTMVEDLVNYWTDEMIECKVEEETKPKPKFKVGDRIYSKYHKPSNDLEIIEVIRGDGHYGYRIKNHHINNTYFMWEYELSDYKLVELKFKAGDRVFNKVTRKWVNIIEFDIETGLYIVRYDDGIQGRSLESELRETRPSFKEIKEVVKEKAEIYISKTELDGLSKSLLYEGFVDGMMTALIEMDEMNSYDTIGDAKMVL